MNPKANDFPQLQDMLASVFGSKKKTRTAPARTTKYKITWKDGKVSTVIKISGFWEWQSSDGLMTCRDTHLSGAKYDAEMSGGKFSKA